MVAPQTRDTGQPDAAPFCLDDTSRNSGGGLLLIRGRNPDGIACAQVMELGPQYIHGELTVALSGRIDRHRDHCAACDEHLAELEQRRDQPV